MAAVNLTLNFTATPTPLLAIAADEKRLPRRCDRD